MGTFELELQQLLYEVYTYKHCILPCFKICNKKDYDYHNLHLNNYLFHFDFQDERSSFYFFGYTAYVYIKIRNLFSLAMG